MKNYLLIGGLSVSILLAGCSADLRNDGESNGEKYTVDEVEKRDASAKKEELESKKKDEAEYGKWYEVGDNIGDRVYMTGILGYNEQASNNDRLLTLQFSDRSRGDSYTFTYTLEENRKVYMKSLNLYEVEYLVVTDMDISANKVRLKLFSREQK